MDESLAAYLRTLVSDAGNLVIEDRDSHNVIRQKTSARDIVTRTDVAVQNYLMERIAADWPGCDFLCEEENVVPDSTSEVFVIDPIDGTTNFARGFRHCGVSVGFVKDGIVQAGAVRNPFDGQTWYAQRGQGSWLARDGKAEARRLQVSQASVFEGSVVAFGLGHSLDAVEMDREFALVRTVFAQNATLRHAGSVALDLCYTAAGTWDIAYALPTSPWDFAAGMIILEEAGGVACSFDGTAIDPLAKSSVVAGGKALVDQMVALAGQAGLC